MDGFGSDTFRLNGSQFAPQSYSGNSKYSRAIGNWTCPVCGASNSLRRPSCLPCSEGITGNKSRESDRSLFNYANLHSHPSVDSREEQSRPNEGRQDHNGTNDIIQDIGNLTHSQRLQLREPGLAMSHWAPPGYVRDHYFEATWSKKPATKTSISKPSVVRSRQSGPVTAPPTPPDLGLPYEVQHYILTTMQRILEEGCFAFASRWAEKAIYEKHWTCPEQVELKTWRDELDSLLPPEAVIPELKLSLASALKDAVNIRNAATHRHLCDNFEIKKMTLQATKLMEIFDDITRQNKFHRLWGAIDQWDTEPSSLEKKREMLESALREISDRPVDDMDWSPNLLSLQGATARDNREESNSTDDPMDMD